MITSKMIDEYFKSHTLFVPLIKYDGKYGVGLVYRVKIKDYGVEEYRLATFETISELDSFVENVRYCDEIITNNKELINSSPTFYLKNKVLTQQMISIEKKKENDKINAYREMRNYRTKRGQILTYKIQQLSKEIECLKIIVETQKQKRNLLFSNRLKNNEKLLNTGSSINYENLPEGMEDVKERDIPDLKVKYAKLLKEKNNIKIKYEKLISFSKKSFLKKIFLSQKNIDESISVIENEDSKKENISKNIVSESENKLIKLFMKYDKYSIISSDARFIRTQLELFKELDELLTDESYNQFLDKAEKKLDDIFNLVIRRK